MFSCTGPNNITLKRKVNYWNISNLCGSGMDGLSLEILHLHETSELCKGLAVNGYTLIKYQHLLK